MRSRCDYPGCTRYARPNLTRCGEHNGAVIPPPADAPAAAHEFFERLEDHGSYQELLGSRLTALLKEAAQASGLDNELGALRLTLAHVLANETDPIKLAQAVAKLTGATALIMRTQRLIDRAAADNLTDAVAAILEELHP